MLTLLKLKSKILLNRYKELSLYNKIIYPLAFLLLYILLIIGSTIIIKHFKLHTNENRIYSYVFFLSTLVLFYPSQITSVYKHMFEFKDLELLFTSPIGIKSVFIFKNLEVSTKFLKLLLIMFIPTQIAYGILLKAPIYYYLILVIVVFLLISIIIVFTQFIITCLMKLIPVSKQREMITLFSGILGFISFATFYFKWENINFYQLASSLSNTWNPLIYPFRIGYMCIELSIYNSISSVTYLMIFLLTIAIIFFIALLVFDLLYSQGWYSVTEGKSNREVSTNKFLTIDKFLSLFFPKYKSFMSKDFKVFIRDTKLWDSAISPLIFFFITAYSSYLQSSNKFMIFWIAVFAVFISVKITFNILTSEGKNILIIRVSPMHTQKVIMSKFILAYLISIFFICIACAFVGIFFRLGVIKIFLSLFISVILSGLTAILASCTCYTHLELDKTTKELNINYRGLIKFWSTLLPLLLLFSILSGLVYFFLFSSKLSLAFSANLYFIRYLLSCVFIFISLTILYLLVNKILKSILGNFSLEDINL